LRIKADNILYLINILIVVLFIVITFLPNNVLRIILGLPVVLFFPGYTLLAALFPRRENLGDIERFALSFGASLAVVPLIGLVLNYTPWGIRLYPILISLFIFIFSMSVIGWHRNRRLPPEESVSLHLNWKLPPLSHLWSGQSRREKIVNLVLAAMVIGAIGSLVYAIRQPRNGEKFTEFYVLNDKGKASNYPSTIFLGQSAQVILGVINHENGATAYKIEIRLGGKNIQEIGPFNLDAEEKREQKVTITPAQTGDKQELVFLLYKEGDTDVYASVHLWIDVSW
jgi:uncharacterized membrane protein